MFNDLELIQCPILFFTPSILINLFRLGGINLLFIFKLSSLIYGILLNLNSFLAIILLSWYYMISEALGTINS